MVDAQEVVTGVEDVADITAELAAHDPSLLAKIEAYMKAQEQILVRNLTERWGAPPEVKPVPQISAEKSQADVILEMQQTIAALKTQIEDAKKPVNTEPVVMEGGSPVPHNLLLDDGSWVKDHPGLATHYSVTVPATATEDEHDVVKKVVAAYPA